MKKIVIAGAGSYIGETFKDYMNQYSNEYMITTLETKGLRPNATMFENSDVVFCVAGIAHIKESEKNRHLYYDVNQNLIVSIAEAAKKAGVRQFVLLSSMAVYGVDSGIITKSTKPKPVTAYGKSKLKADEIINELADDNFLFTCLRPPMVYGKNCRGNYQPLRKFALISPVFPDYNNQRSMIYIGNLCEFIKMCIDSEKTGLFFPQNEDYVRTASMVSKIAEYHNKHMILVKCFNSILKKCNLRIVEKVFGNLVYEKVDTVSKYSFDESIKLTEG